MYELRDNTIVVGNTVGLRWACNNECMIFFSEAWWGGGEGGNNTPKHRFRLDNVEITMGVARRGRESGGGENQSGLGNAARASGPGLNLKFRVNYFANIDG